MRNAVGSVQSAVVFGGTSDIGLAIVDRLIPRGLKRVVLAGRNAPALATAAAHVRGAGLEHVETVEWDALEPSAHVKAVDAAMSAGADDGKTDVDLVLYVA